MILSEENNQEKILTDRVLDVHHEQENMPSASGKASPWSRSLSGSRLTIQSVRGCWAIDGSPPGSPVPGILQERTLEWVAISFSNA